jgi:hypothetical protein
MATYKIESTYLEYPMILETESADEAYEMFTAYCDYQGVDEDDIEVKQNEDGIYFAQAKQYDENDECIARFTFDKVHRITVQIPEQQ